MAGVAPTTHLLFLLLLVGVAARVPESLAGDADALLQVKSGIVDNAGALRSWSPRTAPCRGDASNWAGVMCNNGNLLGLKLESMGLAGTLDLRPLQAVRSLRTLSVMDNGFEGSMPEVKDLPGLRSAFLSGNKFSGAIPDEAFAGMGSLKKVFLSRNAFSGPIPKSLAAAPKLVDVRLDGNKFAGEIPEFQSKSLRVVQLAGNDLEAKVPASLSAFKADVFAGNTKLCGAPLDAKCEATTPSSPEPTVPVPPAKKADEGSMAPGVVVAFVGTLAIVGFVFVVVQRRDKNENFGPAMSIKLSMRKPAVPAKDDRLEQGGTPRGSDQGGSREGSTVRRAAEQGRLVFVREERDRFFELPDLLKATAEVLGSPYLGFCYRATLTCGASMVVKRFKEMNRVGKEDFEEHMRRLGRLSHPNLLPLVAYYYRKEEKLLITDFVPNKSLAHLLHGGGGEKVRPALQWAARLKIVKGVASALSYLYEELSMLTVPHGHLKSSNILLNDCFEPLLTDYALMPVVNQSHAAQLMVAFKSPERRQFGRSSKKSDVWCLGLLILEILTGRPPSYDQGKAGAAGNDLIGAVNSTPEEEWTATVVDGELKEEDDDDKQEIVKLIKIGLACCESNVEARWELKEAVDKIGALTAREREDRSFYSTMSDGGSSRDEEFAVVAIN